MFRLQHIFGQKALMLILGMMVALTIVASPIIKEHLENKVVVSTTQEDPKDEQAEETQVSSLEAVTSALQFNFSISELLAEVLEIEYKSEQKSPYAYIVEAPQKLLKILFRLIISPNAP